MNPTDFPYVWVCPNCRKPLAFMRRKLGIGELLDVKEFVTPAGDQPVEHTPIICGECGYRVGLHEANDDFVQENTGA